MPAGSMMKYFQDQGGPGSSHGGRLHWPGTADGFPFRGDHAPNLQGDEFANIPLALDYHSDAFCLWVPEQKARHDEIMDKIVNGWFMQHRRVERWIEQHTGLWVWLEWVQIYGETPAGKVPGSGHDDSYSQTIALGPGVSAL